MEAYHNGVNRRTLLTLLILLSGGYLWAGPIILDDTAGSRSVTDGATYLVDRDGTLSPEEAYARRGEMASLPEEAIQIPRDGVIWVRISLRNQGSQNEWVLVNPESVELLELFLRTPRGWTTAERTGDQVPFADKAMGTRYPAFLITVPSPGQTEAMIRLFDLHSASLDLAMVPAREFRERYNDATFLLGLAFGFLLALVVYNLVIYAINREGTYLVYALYMAAFFMNQFAQERLFAQYLQSQAPYGFFWFIIFGGATALLGIEFIRRFVETREETPLIDRGMRAVQGALLLLMLSSLFVAGPRSADILNILSLLGMGLILTTLSKRILAGDMLALVCLIGSLLYLLGTGAEILSTLLPIPPSGFTRNGQLYGALAQVLFLGYALGAKSRRLRREYERIQADFRSRLETEVAERTRELQAASRKLEEQATTDALTGLCNREALRRRGMEIDNRLERAQQDGDAYEVSVAYIDIDNFKLCNDSLGHGYGDQLLCRLAEILRRDTRGYDLLFRLGGDEFLIVMPETGGEEARSVLERIRSAFSDSQEENIGVSVSIGLASSEGSKNPRLESIINAADQALFASKGAGKNRVSLR